MTQYIFIEVGFNPFKKKKFELKKRFNELTSGTIREYNTNLEKFNSLLKPEDVIVFL